MTHKEETENCLESSNRETENNLIASSEAGDKMQQTLQMVMFQ
jgi:hypothetical protein